MPHRKKNLSSKRLKKLMQWKALTPEQQLVELDKRRGSSLKQKARLRTLIK